MSNPEDITTTGPVGLKGLSGISSKETPDPRKFLVPYNREAVRNQDILGLGEVTNYSTGQGLGTSRYDRPIYDLEELQHIQDLRSQEQSSLNKLGAGFVKMGTTAVTTFLDSTLGMMIGLGQGLANAVDDDPDTTFRSGLWNNEFNKAVASFQENMEKWVPNYYSEAELDSPWYRNIGTANFWGDKFLKNMGFTIGAMASLAVPGFNMSWVPRASMGIAKGLGAGYSGLKLANKAGKVATYALRTAVSANGEANIEAINAVEDNYNLEMANLQAKKREAVEEAQQWYREHQFDIRNEGWGSPYEIYLNRLAQIDNEFNTAKGEIERGLVNVGNSVHLANMLVLSLTNSLEFGNYLKGGYNLQKGFKNLKMLANGEETSSMQEFAKAATLGQASLAKAPMTAAERTGKVIAGSLGRAASEGFEEGAQRLASDTEQMKEQARVNQWAKDTEDTFYGRGINPDISEDLVDRFKAMHHAWNTSFGDISSTGWEEVFLGALTGGVGTINVRQNRQGKVGLGWQGGIGEAIRDVKEEEQDATKYIEMFNKRIQSEDFRKRYSHALTAMSLTEEMDNFLNLNKVLEYKNREMLKVVNDAYFFKDLGAMDFFKSFYEEMSKGLSEEDVALVREELKTINENRSPFGSMTNKEISETLQDKAKSTIEKIDKTLELYDYLNLKYQDKAYEAAQEALKDDTSFYGGPTAMTEVLLREVASEAAVIWDMERRRAELQKDIDTMDAGTKAVRGTRYEEQGIAELDAEIARRKEKYEKNLSDFTTLAKTIKRVNDLSIRRAAIKNNTSYKEALKNATNLQEVADLYFAIDPESSGSTTLSDEDFNNRQIVFEDALNEAEGENKALLESFKPFIASLNALNELVNDSVNDKIRFSDDGPSPTIDDIANLESLRDNAKETIKNELQYAIRGYIEDPRNPYDKGSLASTIRERAKLYDELAENEENVDEAQSLKNTSGILKEISDELDKLDVVYQAATRNDNPSDDTTDDEDVDDATDDEVDDDVDDTDDTDDDTDEDEDKKEPETTVVTGREDAKKYANRYLKKVLGDDYDKFIGIIDQDDPSKEDREWFNNILKSKKRSFDNFIKRFVREFKDDDDGGDNTGSGTIIIEDKDKRDADVETASKNSMRTNPYRPYLQGSGMDEIEDSDEKEDDEKLKKAVEESKKRPGIINGIGVLATEHAVNTKYYDNWYNNKFFGPIAQGIDYITNNLLWDLMQTGTDGKLKVLYAEFYPKDGSRQTVFKGFKKPHILLVTPYTSKIEATINNKNAQNAVSHNVIETIGKDGKAHKYLVIGAYGYSSGNKVLAEGHSVIDEAIMNQRQASPLNNEWEVLEEGENGAYVNYVYDVSPGYALRQHSEEDTGNRSLKDLLEHNNPTGQQPKDIRFTYWVGNEKSAMGVEPKWVHRQPGDKFYEGKYSHSPGDMFVWMPTADGRFFPQRVAPIAFKELIEGVNGQVYADIMGLIRTIANNRTNKNEVKKALAALRGTDEIAGMLVLSTPDHKGNKIVYSEDEGVIVFYKDGVALVDENIYLERDNTTAEMVVNQLVTMLGEGHKTGDKEETNGLNALVAIHGNKFATNPEYYIDSNLINVNLRNWGTVNARGFAYPVRKDGTIDPLYVPQPVRSTGRTTDDPFKESVWFNGHKFVYDTSTGVVRDSNNTEVTSREVLDQIEDIRTIKENRLKPIVNNGANYYIVGDRVYFSPRRNSFARVDGEQLRSIKKIAEVQKAIQEQREITHTKEELEKELDRLQKKLDAITVSNKEINNFEPSTLDELVLSYLYSYNPGEFNPDEFLKQGLEPAVIKHFSKGQNKFFSRAGRKTLSSLVDDIWHDATERGFIRDDEQTDIITAVLDALNISVLGTSYTSVKGRLREDIKDAIRAQKSQDLRYQIDAIEEELGAIERQRTDQKPPIEDMPDFDKQEPSSISFIIRKPDGTILKRSGKVSIENRSGVIEYKFSVSIPVRPSDIGLTARDIAGNSEDYGSISGYKAVLEDLVSGYLIRSVVVRPDGSISIYGVDGVDSIDGSAAEIIYNKIIIPLFSGQELTFSSTRTAAEEFSLTDDELERLSKEEQLQRQERITTFGKLYSQLANDFFAEGGEQLVDLTFAAFDKIGAKGADDAAAKIYDSTKTRSLLMKVSDKDSLIDLLKKIAECGI